MALLKICMLLPLLQGAVVAQTSLANSTTASTTATTASTTTMTTPVSPDASYHEQVSALEKQLFQNPKYNRQQYPWSDFRCNPFTISMALTVMHVEEVLWNDEYMIWDAMQFPKVERGVFRVNAKDIWKPNLIFSNLATGKSVPYGKQDAWILNGYGTGQQVRPSSRILLKSTFNLKLSCDFDFAEFPYDTQRCPVVIKLPYTSLDETILLHVSNSSRFAMNWDPIKTQSFESGVFEDRDPKTVGSGWQVVNISAEVQYWVWNYETNQYDVFNSISDVLGYFEDETERNNLKFAYPYAVFYIELKRYSAYYGIGFTMPLVISSLTTLLAICLGPSATGFVLLFMNLLIEIVFLLEFQQLAPPATGDMPKMVQYFGRNFAMTFGAVFILFAMRFLSSLATSFPSPLTTIGHVFGAAIQWQASAVAALRQKYSGDSATENRSDLAQGTTKKRDPFLDFQLGLKLIVVAAFSLAYIISAIQLL